MSWIMTKVYDRMLLQLEKAGLREWRREILRSAGGDVLEIGAGTGLNLAHYPTTLDRLVLTEPDDHMRAALVKKLGHRGNGSPEVSKAYAEELPFPNEAFSCVVCTLVLCSVQDLSGAVTEIERVLVPGGRFLFVEHVAAEDRPRIARWQNRLDPFWRLFGGNCHLTRRTQKAIEGAGFQVQVVHHEYPRAAFLAQPIMRGIAVKPEDGVHRD